MKKLFIATAIIAALAFLWWTGSPLFINKTIDDANPAADLSQANTAGPFTISHTTAHPATGDVFVIQDDDQKFVRFENYDGTNGPDLYVYLAKDLEAEEFVSLGRTKGNQGNLNYSVPGDVDLSEYKYVLTWCKAFSVLFDYAEIN